jgi:hypothetical protein
MFKVIPPTAFSFNNLRCQISCLQAVSQSSILADIVFISQQVEVDRHFITSAFLKLELKRSAG